VCVLFVVTSPLKLQFEGHRSGHYETSSRFTLFSIVRIASLDYYCFISKLNDEHSSFLDST